MQVPSWVFQRLGNKNLGLIFLAFSPNSSNINHTSGSHKIQEQAIRPDTLNIRNFALIINLGHQSPISKDNILFIPISYPYQVLKHTSILDTHQLYSGSHKRGSPVSRAKFSIRMETRTPDTKGGEQII